MLEGGGGLSGVRKAITVNASGTRVTPTEGLSTEMNERQRKILAEHERLHREAQARRTRGHAGVVIGIDWGSTPDTTVVGTFSADGFRFVSAEDIYYTRADAEATVSVLRGQARVHQNWSREQDARRKWGIELMVDYRAATTKGDEQKTWLRKQFEIRRARAIEA